jgi:Arc/MetJ-type ribon-helix-helix transcriptional regulator
MNPNLGYTGVMTMQVAVRLPDELVAELDQLVADGQRALARELRRLIAAKDAAILAHAGPDPDLDALAEYAAHVPLGLD